MWISLGSSSSTVPTPQPKQRRGSLRCMGRGDESKSQPRSFRRTWKRLENSTLDGGGLTNDGEKHAVSVWLLPLTIMKLTIPANYDQ